MKITSVEAFLVRIPYDDDRPDWGAASWTPEPLAHPGLPDGHPGDITTEYPPLWRQRPLYASSNEAVIVRVETDSGIIGWGEAHAPVGGEVVKTTINTLLAPLVYGRDPLDIHPIWELLYATMRARGHTSGYLLEAIAGIDIALYDIAGKCLNVPAARLLGGPMRDRIPVYAASLPRLRASAGDAVVRRLTDLARALVDRGYTAFKVKLGLDLDHDCHVLSALREAVGPRVGIAVDANGAYDLALARRAGVRLAEFGIFWLEEPLMPENRQDYARLAEFLDVAVAGGESLYTRWAFNDYLAAGALDLIQPDVCRAGGLSECRRIAMLADVYGVPYAPHVSTGTAINCAAALQFAAAGANLMICEWPLYQTAAGNGILQEPFAFADGFVALPDGPGLGIQVDETALRKWEV